MFAPRKALCQAPDEAGPLAVPKLLMLGRSARNEALSTHNKRRMTGAEPEKNAWGDDLQDAHRCYTDALELSSQSYDAHLGMGIVYLIAAQRVDSKGDVLRESYLTRAKQEFGAAYFIRSAPYAPLYYLAVLATGEGQFREARQLLDVLLRGKYKQGEVHALLAYIARLENRDSDADNHRKQVLRVGASVETLNYVASKHRKKWLPW